mgnify:CR=1 FL=1
MAVVINGNGTITGITTLPDGIVTNDDLAGSIAISKLATTGTPSGSNFLRGDGAYAAAGGGAWTLISSNTASNSATLDVTGLSSTYDTYAMTFAGLAPATDDVNACVRFGDSSGFDSGASDYEWQVCNWSSYTAITRYSDVSDAQMQMTYSEEVGNNTGVEGEGFTGIAYLNISSLTTIRPMITGSASWGGSGSGLWGSVFSGRRVNTQITVDRVQFLFSSGNITTGRFSVYGVKHT